MVSGEEGVNGDFGHLASRYVAGGAEIGKKLCRNARFAKGATWVAFNDVAGREVFDIDPKEGVHRHVYEGLVRDKVGVACGYSDDLGGLATRGQFIGTEVGEVCGRDAWFSGVTTKIAIDSVVRIKSFDVGVEG